MLQLDIPNSFIGGSVLIGTNMSVATAPTIAAYRNPFSSKANPAPNNGVYNVALPIVSSMGASSGGDSFVPLTVSTAGRVSGKGILADGTSFKVLSADGPAGQVPVYVPLYGGRGSIFGWVTVTSAALEPGGDTLWWIKPGAVSGAIFPAGFTNVVQVIGSRYVAVASKTPVLTLTNGMVFLVGGNLVPPFTNSITLGTDNKVMGDNQLTLMISPTKGSVTGSFIDPTTSKKRAMKGVALQAQSQVRGFFLGDNESGRVFVGETPAGP
jgi:hypothetical protein